MDTISQLGIGGIFAILIIKSFIELIKTMRGKNGSDTIKDVKSITIDTNDKVKTLHSLHSKTNQDGLPVWYFPQSIVQDQKKIAEAQAQTAMHMEAISESITEIRSKL